MSKGHSGKMQKTHRLSRLGGTGNLTVAVIVATDTSFHDLAITTSRP
jgi:hypothetical protein